MAFVAVSGIIPIGARQPKQASGSYKLVSVLLSGTKALARPPAGGKPGTLGALARAATAPLRATPGWSARIETPDHPLMVAFSWPGKHDGELQMRTSDGKSFSDWVDVDGMTSHGPDAKDPNKGKDLTSTDPVWVGHDTSEIEVRVSKGTLDGLQLTKFNWDGTLPTSGSVGLGADPAGAEPAQPAIHPRSQWDGGHGYRTDIPGCGSGPDVSPELKMAIIHHTVNANTYSQADVPLLIRGIYNWHTDHNGWCDIGYNFIVDRFGGVWQARSGDIALPVWGAHAVGFNYDTMGVALLGTFQPGQAGAGSPTSAMISSVVNLISWKFGIHGVNPLGKVSYDAGDGSYWPGQTVQMPTIVGHRDTSSTECPGDNVEKLLPGIRQQVANRLAATQWPASHWSPFTNPRSLVARQYQDILYRAATNGYQAWWTNQMVTYGHSGPWIPTSMIGAPETQITLVPMIRLYWAAFDRWADYGGIGVWVQQMRGGHSLVWVGDQFVKSPEFQQRYGADTTDQQYIKLLYNNVLGRDPSQSETTFWVNQLHQPGWTRGRVLINFSESAENKDNKADEVNVGQVYFPMLHRPPDQLGLTWWAAVYKSKGLGALVSNIWSSAEYRMLVNS